MKKLDTASQRPSSVCPAVRPPSHCRPAHQPATRPATPLQGSKPSLPTTPPLPSHHRPTTTTSTSPPPVLLRGFSAGDDPGRGIRPREPPLPRGLPLSVPGSSELPPRVQDLVCDPKAPPSVFPLILLDFGARLDLFSPHGQRRRRRWVPGQLPGWSRAALLRLGRACGAQQAAAAGAQRLRHDIHVPDLHPHRWRAQECHLRQVRALPVPRGLEADRLCKAH